MAEVKGRDAKSSLIPSDGCFIGEDFKEYPLPIFVLSNDVMIHCDIHGEFCPNAYYDSFEIAEMLGGQGYIDCPLCLSEISDR